MTSSFSHFRSEGWRAALRSLQADVCVPLSSKAKSEAAGEKDHGKNSPHETEGGVAFVMFMLFMFLFEVANGVRTRCGPRPKLDPGWTERGPVEASLTTEPLLG